MSTAFFNGEELDALAGDEITVRLHHPVHPHEPLRFVLAAGQPVPLRRMLPALESMDLEVINEHTTSPTRDDGSVCHVYELVLDPGTAARRASHGTGTGHKTRSVTPSAPSGPTASRPTA